MTEYSLKTEMILTLTLTNVYCQLFQNQKLQESFIFPSQNPSENIALKNFLDAHRFCLTSIVLDLPDLKIEHFQLKHLPWWKQRVEILKNTFKKWFYTLPLGTPYSHGRIECKSSLWQEWEIFLAQEKYSYRYCIPLPLLWASFDFESYTNQDWQIMLWKTPEDNLRTLAFFKKVLIYSRLVQNIPVNLEEEIFNLYTYLKREYSLHSADSVLILIDFEPEPALRAFHFEQEPIVLTKEVLLHKVGISGENLYALHYDLLKTFETTFKPFNKISFALKFFLQNHTPSFFNNLQKGLGVLIIYFLCRLGYLYTQIQTVQTDITLLQTSKESLSTPLPAHILEHLIESAPNGSTNITNFLEKIKIFNTDLVSIESWEWETFNRPDHYKIFLRLKIEIAGGEDKKQLFKRWKEQFDPLILTIIKKKLLKKVSEKQTIQHWLIDIALENPSS